MKKQIKAVPAGTKKGLYWCLRIKYYGALLDGADNLEDKTELIAYPVQAESKPIPSAGGGHEGGYDIADMKYYFDTYEEAAWWAKDLFPDEELKRLDSAPSDEKDKEKRRC